MPGSQTSSSTTSKGCWREPQAGFSAFCLSVRNPSSSSTPFKESRISDSSSTIRMLDMLNRGRSGFGSERQLDDEARAYGTVLFDADGTMMIFNDAAYDCEAEAGAAFLG